MFFLVILDIFFDHSTGKTCVDHPSIFSISSGMILYDDDPDGEFCSFLFEDETFNGFG